MYVCMYVCMYARVLVAHHSGDDGYQCDDEDGIHYTLPHPCHLKLL